MWVSFGLSPRRKEFAYINGIETWTCLVRNVHTKSRGYSGPLKWNIFYHHSVQSHFWPGFQLCQCVTPNSGHHLSPPCPPHCNRYTPSLTTVYRCWSDGMPPSKPTERKLLSISSSLRRPGRIGIRQTWKFLSWWKMLSRRQQPSTREVNMETMKSSRNVFDHCTFSSARIGRDNKGSVTIRDHRIVRSECAQIDRNKLFSVSPNNSSKRHF